jgi:hypothetical protein
MNGPPWNDAAPLAGGAGVKEENGQPEHTAACVPMRPPARRNAPPGTSDAAAERIMPHAPDARGRILAFIASRGPDGATDDEGETALGIRCQSYTPRRGELARLGLVVDSGRRRPTGSGCPAAVWIVPERAERPGPGAEGGRG